MSILKSILAASITLTATALVAQNTTAPAQPPTMAQLKLQAQDAMLLQMLEGPAGAMIQSHPDGYFTVFAVGTGSYDFNDPQDKLAARKIAVMKAKANLVKYMKETLSNPESMNDEMTKAKSLSKNSADKDKSNKAVSVEFATKLSEFIQNHAEGLLQGVITLQSKEVQEDEGGTYTVLICTSPKTRMAAQELHDEIDANINGPKPNAEAEQPEDDNQKAAQQPAKPKVIIRKSMSDF